MEGYIIGALFLFYSLFQTVFGDRLEARRLRKKRRRDMKDMLVKERHRNKTTALRSKRAYERKKLQESLWVRHQKNLIALGKIKETSGRRRDISPASIKAHFNRTSIFPLPVRIVLYILNWM